ncbi:MAG: hypothetical protein JRJ85_08365 [Deltaproteobacteria bacterium]|nr:hypothetical protein [Deltaproteobacteria bacterium]
MVPSTHSMPRGVAMAVDDLLDNVAKIEAGQEVLLLAHIDGLYGSDNLVDEPAIAWIQSAIHHRGANASLLWIDEPDKPHAWRVPPVLKGAMSGCDVIINHSFNLVTEDIRLLRDHFMDLGIRYVRNFATTSALLNTAWAQTPSELVAEIRYQASTALEDGASWELTDDNGTHLQGKILASTNPWFPTYASYREEGGGYLPWPEWVNPPVNLEGTSGVFVFDAMLSWWSRYIGIPPYFNDSIRLTIDNGRIVKIEGGEEAEALRRFLATMKEKVGDYVYHFNRMHTGVHPQAMVGPHQCPNMNYRRVIDHSHTSNIHVHIGSEHEDKEA